MENTNKKTTKCNNAVLHAQPDHMDNAIPVVVNGREIWVILDSGAQQTILPRNVVDSECLTGESCKLCDWERNNVRSRDEAIVSIRADEFVFSERVAVSDDMGDLGLLRLPFSDKERIDKLMSIYWRNAECEGKGKSIGAVTTRSMAKNVAVSEKITWECHYRRPSREVTCYRCEEKGHIATNCPSKPKLPDVGNLRLKSG